MLPALSECVLVSENSFLHNNTPIKYSLVLACYGDAPHIFGNTVKLVEYLNDFCLNYELIFVDDASPDNIQQELQRCHHYLTSAGIPHAVFQNVHNKGRGGTVQTGFTVCRGDVVGYIDADLEHAPDAIPASVKRILKGECDVVVGKRFYNVTGVRPMRALASGIYKRLVHFTLALPVSDTESGFKFFARERLLLVLPFVKNQGWFWDTEIVHLSAQFGLRVVEQNIVFERNPLKKSTVNIIKDSLSYLRELRTYLGRLVQLKPLFDSNRK